MRQRTVRPAARLAARAGQPMLETLEPRIVLAALSDVLAAPVYINAGLGNSDATDVAAADLNGDGMADFVTVDGTEISIVLSFKGAYTNPVFMSTPTTEDRVLLADLNNDGDLDIAVLDTQGTSEIYTLLNNGNGTFAAAQQARGGLTNVVDWVIADFTGDGSADYVLLSDTFVRAYIGDGAGDELGASFSESVGPGAAAMDVGDIDGDGLLDIAVIETNEESLSILRGTGGGGVAAVNTSVSLISAVIADFVLIDSDNNGQTNYFAAVSSTGVAWFTTNSSTPGTLSGTDTIAYNLSVGSAGSMVARDLNGDGVRDVAVSSTSNSTFAVLFGAPADSLAAFYGTISQYYMNNFDINGLVAADGNADGRLDLVLLVDNTPILYPNLGNAVFPVLEISNGGTLSGGEDPDSAIFGDLNGDGHADAVVYDAGGTDRELRVKYQRLGRFTIDSAELQTDINTLLAAGLTDTDGDGDLDLVAIGSDSGTTRVQVFRNDGPGVFTKLNQGVIAGNTFGVARVVGGAVNGGSKQDLIIVDGDSNRIIVLAGLGTGNVTLAGRFRLGVEINDLAVADMDGDGDRDLVLATSSGVAVLIEDGNFFYERMYTRLFDGGARAVAVGNFNPGAMPDVAAVTGDGYGEVSFLRNDTAAAGQPVLRYFPQTAHPLFGDEAINLAAADLDNDGRLDLVASGDGERFTVLLGDGFLGVRGTGFYENEASAFNPLVEPALLDADGDGDEDLLYLSNRLGRGGIAIMRAYGDGTFVYNDTASGSIPTSFSRVPPIPIGTSVIDFVTADFNNDGRIDIAAAEDEYEGVIQIYLNTGAGYVLAASVSPGFTASDLEGQIAAGDVTGDGLADVVIYHGTERRHYTLINTGNGTSFNVILSHPQSDLAYEYLDLADINNDGALDIVATSIFDDDIVIMYGRNDGTFRNGAVRTVLNFGELLGSSRPLIADLDGDGNLDIAITESVGGGASYRIQLVRGFGNGSFSVMPQTIWTGAVDIAPYLGLADVDGDGRADLLVSSNSSSSRFFSIVYNLSTPGSPSFVQVDHTMPQLVRGSVGVAAADLDGDGRIELAIAGTDAMLLVELNAAGIPVASSALGVAWFNDARFRLLDLDGDGGPDFVGSLDGFDSTTAIASFTNRLLGVSRVSNVAPAILGGPIWLSPQVAGSTVNISYEQFLALSGVTDADGDEVRFRVVQIVNGTLMGPGGIISGNNTFRPGTSVSYTAPLGPVGGSAVAFRVRVLDPFTESSVVIAVRVPVLAAPLMQPPAPGESEDEGPGWLAFEGLDFGLFADPAEPAVRI